MQKNLEKEQITEEDFWESFWRNQSVPQKVDLNFKNDRVICNTILSSIPPLPKNSSCLEIGCAPGKWMIFMSENLGLLPSGIEYLKSAAETTRKNLAICSVIGNVVHADFFSASPSELFDVVMSFGFIEHFSNTEEVIEKQLAHLKPNGYLVIGIPRFIGLGYFIQKIVDRDLERPLLPAHNLNIMNKKYFASLRVFKEKEVLFNEYVGGFERSLFPYGNIKNRFTKFIVRSLLWSFNKLFSKYDSSWSSSYQMIIVKNTSH